MSAVGSSRVATGVTGFLDTVEVVEVLLAAVVEPALEPALLVEVDDFDVELGADLEDVLLLPVVVFPAAALVPLAVARLFLIPRSFFTLLVTELTSLDMPPSSAASPPVASRA